MQRYHINSRTGNAGLCRALKQCPFGDNSSHYSNRELAQTAYELLMGAPQKDVQLAVEKPSYQGEWNSGIKYIYLEINGVTVAAVKLNDADGVPALWDIETRKEFRNRGYGKKIISMIAQDYNIKRLEHSGGFTQNGVDYVSQYLDRPTNAGAPAENVFYEYDDDNSFAFIHDWDQHQPINP
jgi:GNAT superfamily N-acetyltransferase